MRSFSESSARAAALCALATCLGAGAAENAYERSIGLVKKALEARPNDARVLNILADVHFRRGRFREALAVYAEVSRLEPRWMEPVFAAGEAHRQLEELDAAAASYRAVLQAGPSPQRGAARRRLADVLFAMNRQAEAAAELRAGIAEGEPGAEDLFTLGKCLEAQARSVAASPAGKSDAERLDAEAVAVLERASAADPGHAQTWYVLAAIHRRQGKQDLALKDMESFRRLRPAQPPVTQGEPEKAEALFESGTAVRLARAALGSGDASGAQAMVRHALAMAPDNLEAQAFQGWIFFQLKKLEEAKGVYQAILERDPQHAEAAWNLGKIHLAQGRLDLAGPLLLAAAEARTDFAEGWELLAKMAMEHSLYAERAPEFARNALRRRPSAGNYATLAMALFNSGNEVECERVLEEGLRRHPGDEDLGSALAAVRSKAAGKK